MSVVDLLDVESELLEKLGSFEIPDNLESEEVRDILNASFTLAKSLILRNAIPDVRLQYFASPDYNLGRGNKSKEEVFESNGTYGEEILRHPHFLKYLRFFIFGTNLPTSLCTQLDNIYDNENYDDDRIVKMLPVLKSFFKRSSEMNQNELPEEAFKYAIDRGISLRSSKRLRDVIMKLK